MKKIIDRLFIGSQQDCFYENRPGWYVIHACQYPCFNRYIGNIYDTRNKIIEDGNHLFLNMVDVPLPLYPLQFFIESGRFITEHRKDNILVHCNQGMSRAPSIVLVWMAMNGMIPNTTYQEADLAFRNIYPDYHSNISNILVMAWEILRNNMGE